MTSETGDSSSSTTADASTGAVTDSGMTGSSSEGTSAPTTDATTTGAPAVCGDGVVAVEEICDDGNADPDDGCDKNCQKTGAVAWTTIYNGAAKKDDWARGVAVDKTGRIVVVGNEEDAMSKSDMLILVLDPDGKEVWKKVIPGAAGLYDSLADVVIGDDGTIYVSGYEGLDDVSSIAVVRSFAPDGKDGWTFTEPAPDTGFATANDLQLANGALYSVGQEDLGDTGSQLVARKHKLTDGTAAWKGIGKIDQPWAFGSGVAVTGTTIVAVGGAGPKPSFNYPLIVKFDDTGAMTSFAVDDSGDAGAWLDASPIGDAGDVVLAGRYAPPGNTQFDFTVSRVGPDGAVKWIKYHDQNQVFDAGEAVAVGPDESVFAAGRVTVVGEVDNVLVRRFSGAGDIVWSSFYNNADTSLYDAALGAALGPDFMVAAGYTHVQGEGLNVWVRRYALD